MTSRFAVSVVAAFLPLADCTGTAAPGAHPAPARVFLGYISESDCGQDHAVMLATGKMGSTDRECVLKCVRQGAAFGFVDSERKGFYQLDDQEKPRPFAGRRVRLTGRLEGDTFFVQAIEAAD
jgi:hypothetical protein